MVVRPPQSWCARRELLDIDARIGDLNSHAGPPQVARADTSGEYVKSYSPVADGITTPRARTPRFCTVARSVQPPGRQPPEGETSIGIAAHETKAEARDVQQLDPGRGIRAGRAVGQWQCRIPQPPLDLVKHLAGKRSGLPVVGDDRRGRRSDPPNRAKKGVVIIRWTTGLAGASSPMVPQNSTSLGKPSIGSRVSGSSCSTSSGGVPGGSGRPSKIVQKQTGRRDRGS